MSENNLNWVQSYVTKMHDNPPPESQWRYKLWLPDFLAEWDVFAIWEKERFMDMEKHLKQGDILFDIGTEIGWQNIIYAQFCGPENMVLIEPNKDYWPNIKAIWEKNYPGILPLANYIGFFSNKTTKKELLPLHTWPKEVNGDPWIKHLRIYRNITQHGRTIPQIKIDDYVKYTGIVPNALTMDVEGADLFVLQGAEKTLRENNLKVWVSIHPELGEKNYQVTPEMLHEFMASCGYNEEFLATDHEEHWRFYK